MRAGLVLVVALIVARAVQRVIVKAGEKRGAEPHGLGVVAPFLFYLALVVGFFYALNVVGVELRPLIGLLGVFGLAVALAVQDIFANFIAGIILLIRRPFRPGDEVQVGYYEGLVEDINLRVSRVRQVDGVAVLVQNSAVLANAIVNYTQRPQRRTTLAVGVAYASDLPRWCRRCERRW